MDHNGAVTITVIDHRDDILSFVNDYVNQPNEKLKSTLSKELHKI
jgi:hypothetical protein